MGTMLDKTFFDRPAHEVAPDLIGAQLLHEGAGGIIVEVEAYDETDPASHSFVGLTPRNRVMFGPPGHAYVYKIYGIHYCLNFVCRPGSAVLVRALQPTHGLEAMQGRRGAMPEKNLCSGPGKLAQALGIDLEQNGLALDAPPFDLLAGNGVHAVATGVRIGISKGVDTPWRFVKSGSPYLSKPLPKGAPDF